MEDSIRSLLLDSARREFERYQRRELEVRPEQEGWQAGLWEVVEALGLPRCLVAEENGGSGLGVADAMALLRLSAQYALPLPLGETIIAHHLLALSGIDAPSGPLALAPVRSGESLDLRQGEGRPVVHGIVRRVPWGRDAQAVVLIAEGPHGPVVVRVDAGHYAVVPGSNLASEPRDTLVFEGAPVAQYAPAPMQAGDLMSWGATLRSAQIAGACEAVFRLAVEYANLRVQFGRPISKFQMVQQHLSTLATQSGICDGAAMLGIDAIERESGWFGVACAKARASEAGALAASTAHQVFGAIGFSREHDLHRYTQRLWSWREEFGSERYWAQRLGSKVLAMPAEDLWPLLTD